MIKVIYLSYVCIIIKYCFKCKLFKCYNFHFQNIEIAYFSLILRIIKSEFIVI